MPHTPDRPFRIANPRYEGAKKLLEENDTLLAQIKSPAAQNTNAVLRYLVETVYRIETDLIHLHSKLQPILKSIEADSDWRTQFPRDEDE